MLREMVGKEQRQELFSFAAASVLEVGCVCTDVSIQS